MNNEDTISELTLLLEKSKTRVKTWKRECKRLRKTNKNLREIGKASVISEEGEFASLENILHYAESGDYIKLPNGDIGKIVYGETNDTEGWNLLFADGKYGDSEGDNEPTFQECSLVDFIWSYYQHWTSVTLIKRPFNDSNKNAN